MSWIKCECGKEFLGQEDKEDTCPDCLKKLINPDAQDIINESNEPIGEQEQADLNLSKCARVER